MSKSTLEQFKIRWRRWLGNKTRINKPNWITLLDTNWLAWIDKTLSDCDPSYTYHNLTFTSTRKEVKSAYIRAINYSTMSHLYKLDELYTRDKLKS